MKKKRKVGIILILIGIGIPQTLSQSERTENMIYLSLDDTFSLLCESVGSIPAKKLVKKCRNLGMNKRDYRDLGYDPGLPHFDKGYWFNYKTNDEEVAYLEILEKDEKIFQAGIQIVYKPKSSLLFKKMEKHYKFLSELSEKHYGSGFFMKLGSADILNFGDNKTVCYLSKAILPESIAINFRIGDKEFWQ